MVDVTVSFNITNCMTDCSNKMFLFHNGYATVLLLALTQSLVFAFDHEKNETMAVVKMIVGFLHVSWIDEIDLDIRPSESSCALEFAALKEAIKSGEMWALRMLDASSKIQSGILEGNIHDLGMYSECIAANGQYNDTKIRGKHCKISIGSTPEESRAIINSATSSLSFSLCVPSSCSEMQIDQVINSVLQNASVISDFGFIFSETSCVEEGSKDFTMGEILTIVFFLIIGVFMVLCTICDLVKRSRLQGVAFGAVNEMAKFSLYTNAIALLSTKLTSQMMPAIHGIKFLSMCWIVLGHRYLILLQRPIVDLVEVGKWYNSWISVCIQAAPFAVDTFFVISGFLMAHSFFKSKQAGQRSNFLMMYIHRYLRLTPCVAILTLFIVFLLHRVGNGLAQKVLVKEFIDPCLKSWWTNFLYVQNFVIDDRICLSHSWYLAVDMQLFWISPIILYPLYHWPKRGLGILCLFLIVSVVTPGVLFAVNGYSHALLRTDTSQKQICDAFHESYIPTYNRASGYFIGVLLGYDLANKRRHLSQVNVAINWVLASFLMLFCGWATYRTHSSNFPYNLTLELAFASWLRPSWSISIAWVVYACTQGYGGFVTGFLSLPIFRPLCRLSYCIYLLHTMIQMIITASAQTPVIFHNFETLNNFWSDLILSIMVAFIFSLFFECPVIVLEKIIRNRGHGSARAILVQKPKKDVELGIQNKAMTEE